MRAEERVYPNNVQNECVYPWSVLQKKTDPVEVTPGPDPGDKAEAWKGDRTPDGCNRLWARDDELGRAPVPPCTTRAPKRKGSGVSRPQVGPPDASVLIQFISDHPKVKKEKLSVGRYGPPKDSRGNPTIQ